MLVFCILACQLLTCSACLQSLGLIPRTPSPAPDPDRIRAQNEEMIKEAKRKEREKNREIERLKVFEVYTGW
jgi:hypothetical protein